MKKEIFKVILLLTIMIFANVMVSFAAGGWANDGAENWVYVDNDGSFLKDTIKPSGNDKFYLDENGYMVRDYLLEDYNDEVYYFDDSGKMVRNTWVAIEPIQVYNGMDDNPPTIYLYYFGNNGKAYKANNGIVKKTIDGKKYLFNENGQMLFGWIDEEGNRYDEYNSDEDPFVGYCYYAGDETDGVLREGWCAYEEGSVEDRYYMKTTLWFYFRKSDNKKIQSSNETELKKKIINGKTYAFDDNGVMVVGWDTDLIDPDNEDNTLVTNKYYIEQEGVDYGRLPKKEWIFAVPSMKQNLDDHDQEVEQWFYSLGDGSVVKGIVRKINSNFYIFNDEGIMRSGLCIVDKSSKKFRDCIDVEKTDGKDFIISRHYISKETESAAIEFSLFDEDTQMIYYFVNDEESAVYGQRQTGERAVAFGDDDYSFVSTSTGEYEGYKKKKYYQAGIKLKPDDAVGMGLIFLGYDDNENAEAVKYAPRYHGIDAGDADYSFAKPDVNHENILTHYVVLRNTTDMENYSAYPVFAVVNSSGSRLKNKNSVKKDKSGNYWAIGMNGTLINIYEVPVKYDKKDGVWKFRSDIQVGTDEKPKKTWIPFGTNDVYGKTCYTSRKNPGDYALTLDDTYCVNFRFADN